jgi:secreted trypsin-like serine protease
MLPRRLVVFIFVLSAIVLISNSQVTFNRSECGDVRSASGFVVSGRISASNAWPWLAALFVKQSKQFFGAGSLISAHFVLTAAHCLLNKNEVKPRKPEEVIVYFGMQNLSEALDQKAVKATPEEFFIHHEWNPLDSRFDADIAILRFAEDIPLSNKVWPVCLWTSEYKPSKKNDGGMIVGW